MSHHLDETDIRILHLLQHDARLTNKEIADKIGKSVSPVFERIRRLQNEGYIKRFIAVLDNKMINRNLVAYTHVHLKAHAREMMLSFEREVTGFGEVMECYHMTGEYDFLLKVVVKDMDAYYDFVINRLAKVSNVGTVQSFFVLKESKHNMAYLLDFPLSSKKRSRLKV